MTYIPLPAVLLPRAAHNFVVHGTKTAALPAVLLQVTAQLVALYFQTQQQHNTPGPWDVLIHNTLTKWLQKTKDAAAASPGSRAAAAVRQQLQDLRLLQRLGPAMDAAAA